MKGERTNLIAIILVRDDAGLTGAEYRPIVLLSISPPKSLSMCQAEFICPDLMGFLKGRGFRNIELLIYDSVGGYSETTHRGGSSRSGA